MGICYIAGAGKTALPVSPGPGDCLIAADGGYAYLRSLGLAPDLIVGDFDSLGYVPREAEVCRYPVEKDDTDMMLAIKLGLDRGYRRFLLLGGMGGRLDHTIANLQSLGYLLAHGARGVLAGDDMSGILLENGTARFSPVEEGILSVFAYGGEARGVTLTGLQYPLLNATLTPEFPLGVSNHFTGVPAAVSVSAGRLLVLWSGGPERYLDL